MFTYFDLNSLLNIDAIKQPIKINSVRSGNVSTVGAPAFDQCLRKHEEILACWKCARSVPNLFLVFALFWTLVRVSPN